MPASSMRIAKALFAAPLVAPIIYFLLTLPIPPATFEHKRMALQAIFSVGLVLSFVGAVVIGMPILALLMRFRMTKLPWFALFGTLIGTMVIYPLASDTGGSTFSEVRLILIGGVCGLASASTFWHLAFRERAVPAKAVEGPGGEGNRTEAQPA